MNGAQRTRQATRADALIRLKQADEFLETATESHQLHPGRTNVVVANAVLAGIAASDAICAARLGEYAIGEAHVEAIRLLGRATSPDPSAANDLRRLLGQKQNSSYTPAMLAPRRVEEALRWASRLVAMAQNTLSGP